MKIISLYAFLIVSLHFVVDCTEFTKINTLERTNYYKDITDKPLIENTILHHFSSPHTKDKFTISISGETILKGKATFVIENNKGKIIWKEIFEADDLLDYSINYDDSESIKEDYIKKRIVEFFKEENFLTPAIDQNSNFDPDYSLKEIWDDIYSDRTAIGFYFYTGGENGTNIAYSKSKKKVVHYFTCC